MTPAHNSAQNSAHNPENDLGRTLSRQADRFAERGGSPLELDQVLSRAGEIRRGRRMRASIVMAAVVVAVAVPVGISAIGNDPTDKPAPPTASSTKGPVRADNSPIALGDLKTGDAPKGGYYQNGRLYYQGNSVPLAGPVPANVVRMSGGFLVAQQPEGGGDLVAKFVSDDGSPSPKTWPTTGSIVTTDDGAASAFIEPNGTVVWVEAGAARYAELGKIPGNQSYDVDAIVGSNCSGRAEGDGCLVYVHSSGAERGVWTINAHGEVKDAAAGMVKLNAVSIPKNLYGGQTTTTDSRVCSEVRDGPDGGVLWPTCEFTFVSFSPDGHYLLATSPGDGAGPTDFAVLDATTGDTVLHLQAATDNFVSELTWEDSEHVLASVYDHGSFAVERFSLNGARQYATNVAHDTDDSMVSPIKLG